MCKRCINHEMCQGTGCKPKNDLQELIDENKDSVIKTIEEQPKVGEWIPCSQLLPLDGVNVLITDEYNNMSVGYLEIGMRRWHDIYDCIILDEIIAWQPLPEPYTLPEPYKGE